MSESQTLEASEELRKQQLEIQWKKFTSDFYDTLGQEMFANSLAEIVEAIYSQVILDEMKIWTPPRMPGRRRDRRRPGFFRGASRAWAASRFFSLVRGWPGRRPDSYFAPAVRDGNNHKGFCLVGVPASRPAGPVGGVQVFFAGRLGWRAH